MRFGPLFAAALCALVLAIYLRRREAPEPPRSSLEVGAEDELLLRVETRREGGRRRLRLVSPSGAAALVLEDAEGSGAFAFGKGVLEPGDRREGAGLVADVARWLGRETPPEPAERGALEPFPVSYAVLGDRAGFDANKLFFEFGHRYAEVYLNLDASGTRAALLEKDEDYREDLLALLAMALRDGRPPRRTTATDPNLGSDEAVFPGLRPLACEGELRIAVWTARGFLGVVGHQPATLVLWTDIAKPPTGVGTVDGVVTGPLASPGGEHVAAIAVRPREPGSYTSEDPADLVLLDVAAGGVRTLAQRETDFFVMVGNSFAFSPDGRRLAVAAPVDTAPPRPMRTRIFDVATGARLLETDAARDLDVEAWSPDGLVLCRAVFDDDFAYHRTWYRWNPGAGDPEPSEPPAGPRSPDGSYTIVPTPDGNLEVRGPEGTRTFVCTREEERAFFRGLREFPPSWCGPHGLLIPAVDVLLLDLATLELRHVFAERGYSFVAADPAGREVLAIDAQGLPHWGKGH